MEPYLYKILYFLFMVILIYTNYNHSKRTRARYERRDIVSKAGRDTSDETWDYFVFEFGFLQVPLLFAQLISRLVIPKRYYFQVVAILCFSYLLMVTSFKLVSIIMIWCYICYLVKTFFQPGPHFKFFYSFKMKIHFIIG